MGESTDKDDNIPNKNIIGLIVGQKFEEVISSCPWLKDYYEII